jgi:hypothetical protein
MNKQKIAEKLSENHQKFAGFVSSLNDPILLLPPK